MNRRRFFALLAALPFVQWFQPWWKSAPYPPAKVRAEFRMAFRPVFPKYGYAILYKKQ